MSDRVLTQHSKFCIVYVNGAYYGIYCMKENVSEKLYAAWAGVDRSSVETAVPHDGEPESYAEMYSFIKSSDMADPENYRRACEMLDIDSFIDWVIVEGVSANMDLFRNVKFFRSTETDGRYQMVLFDLDGAMKEIAPWACVFFNKTDIGYGNTNASNILDSLLRNTDFRAAFLRRYGEVYKTVLSNERILERVDCYESLLRPEIERDRARWSYGTWQWEYAVSELRLKITAKDWENECLRCLDAYISLTDAERAAYF
ncbi:MAG: CotH kinase family protein [Oscillospiraceae bacterium]|nr:CotH kinase family protein [Oscillospiraceae bacterium]